MVPLEEDLAVQVLETGAPMVRRRDGSVFPWTDGHRRPRGEEIFIPLNGPGGERFVYRAETRRLAEIEDPASLKIMAALLAMTVIGHFPSGSLISDDDLRSLTTEPRFFLSDLTGDHPVIKEIRAMLRAQAFPHYLFLTGEPGTGRRFICQLILKKIRRGNPLVFPLSASRLLENEWETLLPAIPPTFRLPRSWVLTVSDMETIPPWLASFLYPLVVQSREDSAPTLIVMGGRVPSDGIFSAQNDWWVECGKVITLPPLRERLDDLRPLIDCLLRRLSREEGGVTRKLTSETEARIRDYPWPGNIRELKNCLERMLIRTSSSRLREKDLPLFLRSGDHTPLLPQLVQARIGEVLDSMDPDLDTSRNILSDVVQSVERLVIGHALRRCGGHQGKAARFLGINRNTLRSKIRLYGLESEAKRHS